MTLRSNSRVYGHFKHVLVVSSRDVHSQRDQLFMQAFSPDTVTVMTAGADALDFIAHNKCDLVLCDTELEDMEGVDFVQRLNQHLKMKMMPVILITLDNRKETVLKSISAGCSGYVIRPYSMKTFERYLVLAKQLVRYPEIEDLQLEEARELVSMGDFDDAIETFEEILDIQDEAQRYYDMGMHYLLEEKFGKAIVSFKKAVRLNDLFAEAYKGLADAYRGKGDMSRCQSYLQKAAEVHAQFDRLEEAKSIFIEALQLSGDMPNPFNTLGVKLRKQGDYPGALHAYFQALELTPKDEHIYFNIAKAYYYMGDLPRAGEHVAKALDLQHTFEEADKLFQRVYGKPYEPPDTAPTDIHPAEESRSVKDV